MSKKKLRPVEFAPSGPLPSPGIFSVGRFEREKIYQWVVWSDEGYAKRDRQSCLLYLEWDPYAAGAAASLDDALAAVRRIAPDAKRVHNMVASYLAVNMATRASERAFIAEHGIEVDMNNLGHAGVRVDEMIRVYELLWRLSRCAEYFQRETAMAFSLVADDKLAYLALSAWELRRKKAAERMSGGEVIDLTSWKQ